jgi:hypothetical protein
VNAARLFPFHACCSERQHSKNLSGQVLLAAGKETTSPPCALDSQGSVGREARMGLIPELQVSGAVCLDKFAHKQRIGAMAGLLKILGGTIGVIFLIGLLVVIGLLMLIF